MSVPPDSTGIRAAISLVTLGVRDVLDSTRFYEALGFQRSEASVDGEVSFFRTAGAILAVWGAAALADDVRIPGLAGPPAAVSLAINVASPAEVDSAVAVARAAGARVTKEPQATDWGGYHAYFADPDGHLWEVAHNPGWPLDNSGLPQLP
jgi:catechol 2,3-dioxygenase-like lactoylglutathione lyase family enzyme